MNTSRFRPLSILFALLLLVVLAFTLAPVAGADPSWEVVASGLDNPRGLAFDPRGALYVTESGRGGEGPCLVGPEGDEVCYGATGAVTRIWRGTQKRVVDGLPSLADHEGGFAIGPTDISFLGVGNATVIIGLGQDPAVREQEPEFAGFGHLWYMRSSGKLKHFADVAAYEAAANPDGGEIDSNPYAVLNAPGRRIVADAGANALLEVAANGSISTLAVFPNRDVPKPPFLPSPPFPDPISMQAVPNAVTMGPDGAVYIGQLTGFPFPVGGARVYRLAPGGATEIFADGFTNIIDLAFDAQGNLYVLEITANGLLSGDPTGALIKVAPDGSRTTIASDGLVAPTGLAVGPDGALYVSNYGVFPDMGEVVRITP